MGGETIGCYRILYHNSHSVMFKIDFILIALIGVATAAFWTQHMSVPVAPIADFAVHGFAYAPASTGDGTEVDPTVIAADLALLSKYTSTLRTYTVSGSFARIPALARKHGLSVALGAWLEGEITVDQIEVDRLIELAATSANVHQLIVGNESLVHKRLTATDLIGYLDQVRAASQKPVTTAEPWHIWLEYPNLADHVDLITVHLLPYWEGVSASEGADFVLERLQALRQVFPNKTILIGEVGWPTRGRAKGDAVASEADQALFLKDFLSKSEALDVEYFVIEAFDQPWKRSVEGEVGGYWGVFDLERQPRAVIIGNEHSRILLPLPGVLSLLVAVLLFLLLIRDSAGLASAGRLSLAIAAGVTGNATAWAVYDQASRYWSPEEVVFAVLMAVAGLFALLVLLVEVHEWAEVHWTARRRLQPRVPEPLDANNWPLVSVHVPVYNEPPAMVIATLDALAAIDYPRLEVWVIDNNTPDTLCWRPVETHCALLGPRFHFRHVDGLAGYKAGALNLALRLTDADADLVAVIDSDYRVSSNWLRVAVPHFADPKVALVQAPQDYHDSKASPFKAACTAEYATFFNAGMITRNERNAIIQHGTMTIVARDVLETLGGWAEWSITEDAELGLRILDAGYEAVYLNQRLGSGISPDEIGAYKTQRHRWVFGAMQIMRRHAGVLFGSRGNGLSAAQRYHFIAGWLPWMADGLSLIINGFVILWSLLMVLEPARFAAPPTLYLVPPLFLFGFRLFKALNLQVRCNRVGPMRAAQGALAGLALSFTVGQAVVAAGRCTSKAFVRTPKFRHTTGALRALYSVRGELLLGLALSLCMIGVGWRMPEVGPHEVWWIALLTVAALPQYAAAILALMVALQDPDRQSSGSAEEHSSLSEPPCRIGRRRMDPQ
jgi:exo-beta-1,3-glucanase (GH17 family)/cellulose synthase/poly-beta-1,6-N-acetylglucosamine synthase-like glycosyltransferase